MRNNANSFVPFGARKLGLLMLATGAFVVAYTLLDAPPQAAAAPAVKMEVCHIPPGNPDNFHTITISENALPAHLAHGDFAGACNALCSVLCNDGDLCTVDDDGNCEAQGCPPYPREAVDCGDPTQCIVPTCESVMGCVDVILEGGSCDDGALCTRPDTCDADGLCVGTPDPNCCEDDAACGATYCNGNFCGMGNECDSTGFPCDDGVSCTADVCSDDPAGCKNMSTDELCDDDVDCTLDSCDSLADCQHQPVDSACDDGVECTINEYCDPASGCQATADDSACSDGDRCTVDLCDPLSPSIDGCSHTPISGCCNSDDDCQPGQECDETGPEPVCQSCVTALDYFNSGSTLGFRENCEQSCPNPRDDCRAFSSTDLFNCAVHADRPACDQVNADLEAQHCSICPPPPPPPPSDCPCWDGSATSAASDVSNVVELWEKYGPANCSSDSCRDTMDSDVTLTSAECLTLTTEWMRTDVVSNANQGLAQCTVVVSGDTLAQQTFPRGSSEDVACVTEHDMYITLGGSFPSYSTDQCGLAGL